MNAEFIVANLGCAVDHGLSDSIIALIVAGSVIVYGFMAGLAWQMIENDDHGQVLGSMFWPLALPALLGVTVVRALKARASRPRIPPARMVP